MTKFIVIGICALLLTTQTYAAYEQYSDGSYTEYTEGGGMQRWVHSVPVGGGQYRQQYRTEKQFYNYGGVMIQGEYFYSVDYDLDGTNDSVQQAYTTYNFAPLISKLQAKDRNGIAFTQYNDSQPRFFTSRGYRGRPEKDDRKVVRIYANGICYPYEDGSCAFEPDCDPEIQNFNQLTTYGMLETARKLRDSDPLGVKVAEMRYEREQFIHSACKASRRQ